MASPTVFEVTHSCGHQQDRDVADTAASKRDDKLAWFRTQPCSDCRRAMPRPKRPISKELKSEWAALHQEAIADQEQSNLPPLRGSEKQVPFGTDERFKILRRLYEDLVQAGEMNEDEFDEQVLGLARRIDLAKWWIDQKEAANEVVLADLQDPGTAALGTENPY